MKNTGMAVTIDIGDPDDVHPLNKQDVAKRLALWARAKTYGESIEYSGPLFRQLTREGASLRIWFDHAEGLTAKALRGFEVAGDDDRFHAATARIEGATIIADSTDVPHPVRVRYGWANSPDCDLFNKQGLPASPFQASLSSH